MATETAAAAAKAEHAAAAAAHTGGLVVRELTEPDEHRAAQLLLSRVWRTHPENPPVPGDLMRALSHAGAYVAGAFADDDLVGATTAFLTGPGGEQPTHLHSHITGVVDEARPRHAGFALKLHQRAWALRRGVDTISWTFDPLVRRNAFFNITKLCARVSSYLVDFYGEMTDGVNAGQGSDRLLVEWPLASAAVAAAAAGGECAEPAVDSGHPVLSTGPDGWPRSHPAEAAGALVCAVPGDIEHTRDTDPECARAWRRGVRGALGDALGDGYLVAGVTRSGWYVLRKGEEPR